MWWIFSGLVTETERRLLEGLEDWVQWWTEMDVSECISEKDMTRPHRKRPYVAKQPGFPEETTEAKTWTQPQGWSDVMYSI